MGHSRGMDSQLALSQDTVPSPKTKAMAPPSEEEPGVAAQVRDAWTQSELQDGETSQGQRSTRVPYPTVPHPRMTDKRKEDTAVLRVALSRAAPRVRQGTQLEGAALGTGMLLA